MGFILKITFPHLEVVRILLASTTGGLKLEKVNEEINDLAWIDIIIIITISLVIDVLSFKKWVDIGAKYEKLTNKKIQWLERPTDEIKKNIHT